MELSTHHQEEDVDIPIPINSSYSGHMIHHHHHLHHHDQLPHNHILPISISAPQSIHSNRGSPTTTTTTAAAAAAVALDHVAGEETAVVPYKKPGAVIKYRECLKNHAASMGGNATDGCGEFMPSGEEGTIEALTCSACNCHRNFHRKDHMEGDNNCFHIMRQQRKLLLTQHPYHKTPDGLGLGYPTASGALVPSRSAAPISPHQMIMSYNMGGPILSESDEQDQDGGGGGARPAHSNHNYNTNNNNNQYYHHNHNHNHNRGGKKRFRTKFSQEQKDKMLNFAEKVGWKIQKQEESIVQQFCQEIGVKRRVLKVWMHNNKHSLAKKNNNSSSAINTTIDADHHHDQTTNSLS